ncbi:hypothetical protein ACC775_38330, partial [Rhizobium ruizarguesonis]
FRISRIKSSIKAFYPKQGGGGAKYPYFELERFRMRFKPFLKVEPSILLLNTLSLKFDPFRLVMEWFKGNL